MKKFLLTLVVVGMCIPPVCAAPLEGIEHDIAVCSKIEDRIKRLECFDTIVATKGLSAYGQKNKSNNQWEIIKDKSKIDDSETVIIATKSIEPIEDRYGSKKEPYFAIRCKENKTDVIVAFGMFLDTESMIVTERIDSEEVRVEYWSISNNKESILNQHPIQFIKSLFGHDKLLLQVMPYNENQKIVEFNISGIEDITEPLQKACKWE